MMLNKHVQKEQHSYDVNTHAQKEQHSYDAEQACAERTT